jgi:ATP-dependent RNA helicase MSS116, mitochondrial
MGFRPDLDAITNFLPPTPERQTFLFSATVSKAIRDVARQTLDTNHTFINCVSDDAPPVHAHIPQYHTVLPDASHQLPHVLRLLAHDQLSNVGKSKTIVFLPTTKLTQLFATFLREMSDSLPAGRRTRVHEIHSLLTQATRTRTSDRFRNDTSGASVLVSSDVSARGVDYPGVTRVIQVGIPGTADQYVHRVGRTGRGAERNGRADLVLLPFEAGFVKWQLNNIPIQALSVSELQSEVHQLATSYDSDPNAFLQARSPDWLASSSSRFAPQVLRNLEKLDQSLSALYDQIDPDAARSTVSSMMGYYGAKASELRCSRRAVLDGLMEWAVQACGMKTPPRFSSDFLARLGFSDEKPVSPRGKGNFGSQRRSFGLSGRSGFPNRNSDSSDRDSHFSGRNSTSFGRDSDSPSRYNDSPRRHSGVPRDGYQRGDRERPRQRRQRD